MNASTFKEYLRLIELDMPDPDSDTNQVKKTIQATINTKANSLTAKDQSAPDIIKSAALDTAKKANPLAVSKLGDMAKPTGVAAMKKK